MDETKVIEFKGASVYHLPESGSSRRRCGDMVLSDVNLSVGGGEMIYFIGRVGSGKSSLLRTMYAELPLLEGEGHIAGFDLRLLKRRDVPMLRRRIGIVFQDYKLLDDRNVLDNLLFVMRATGWKDQVEMRRRIAEVLETVRLNNKEYKMPYELSGGEKQRVAIARALVNSPQLILADEPTGNLDPAAADDVMELFRRIVESGCSIIMSTHNIGIINDFPARTFRFSKGHIEELDINRYLSNE